MARARLHDGLSLLRMAARRVPLQDPGWAARVARTVAVGAATLAAEASS
jgi:hypothetical protein